MTDSFNFYLDAFEGLPGKGPIPAEYAIVGIAPSTKRPAHRKLEPFGAASYNIIAGLQRLYPSLYVTNVVKEPHVPGKPPRPTTVRAWTGRLYDELRLVSPRRILALGDTPARALCGPAFRGLREDRGTLFRNPELDAIVVPTYHFAAGARNSTYNQYINRDLERFFTLPDPEPDTSYTLVGPGLAELVDDLPYDKEVVLDIETTGLEYDARVTQLGIAWAGSPAYLLMDPDPPTLVRVGSLLASRRATLVGHNLQFDLRCLIQNTGGKWARHSVEDTMVLAHIAGHEVLSLKHLATLLTDRPGPHSGGGPGDPTYLAEDVHSTLGVFEKLTPTRRTYAYSVLRDLVPLMAAIYHRGVYVDRPRLEEVTVHAKEDAKARLSELEELTGHPGINWNSTLQVVPVLEDAGIPLRQRTKAGGITIKEAVLLPLRTQYPVVDALLKYREAAKMVTGFCDPYLEMTRDEPFLHPTAKLTGTATGRLSMANPNLQQVTRTGPLKTIFVPRWDNGLLGIVDLEQAELRVAALLSGDEQLAQALLSADTHRFIASKVFRKPEDQVDSTERKASKKVTFGVLYGGTAEGLAAKSDLDVSIVVEIMQMLAQEFPDLAKWMRKQRKDAQAGGYITTPFGRTRSVGYLVDRGDIGRVGRLAVNTPIQSIASDTMLVVTRGLDKRIRQSRLKSRILFGVHDSLLTEIYPGEAEQLAHLVQQSFRDLNQTPLADYSMFHILPLTGTFMTGVSWAAMESTNEHYSPGDSWNCSSLGSDPELAIKLPTEDEDERPDDDEEEWEDLTDVA